MKKIILPLILISVLFISIMHDIKSRISIQQQVQSTGTVDPNLVTASSGCPEYWRFNSKGYAQRCVNLTKQGVPQRTEELLQKYGLNNYNEREVIGRLHGIKTELLVCITYADTSIGKYLKSENNIGNVGNNDRGQTVRYKSLLKGIDAIGRTLENQYLGMYEELWQLSGQTNKQGKVYATSKDSWLYNVMNCLSLIHDKKIDGGFQFRR